MDTKITDELTPASCLIEVFCHLISDHRIHHIAIDEATYKDPEEYVNFYESRMKVLYVSGKKAIERGGGMKSTMLMRYHYLTEKQITDVDAFVENYSNAKKVILKVKKFVKIYIF